MKYLVLAAFLATTPALSKEPKKQLTRDEAIQKVIRQFQLKDARRALAEKHKQERKELSERQRFEREALKGGVR